MYLQGFLERQRLELEARLADPALAELRRPAVVERMPDVDDPPTFNQVRLRPGEAPRVVARGDAPERYLTYGDIQDWPFRDQYPVLIHARTRRQERRLEVRGLLPDPSDRFPKARRILDDIRAIEVLLKQAKSSDVSFKLLLEEHPEYIRPRYYRGIVIG